MKTRTTALLCFGLLLLPTTSFSQQAASNFRQSNSLQDNPAVRDPWRKAYKDFKPPAAVSRRNKSLDARRNNRFLKNVVC